MNIARQAVLLDMCFNFGIGRLEGFHNTLAAMKAGDWQAAHDGMLDSAWAASRPSRSPARRANAERGASAVNLPNVSAPSSQSVERLLFGCIVIVGYILVTWYGASGKAEAKEAGQIVHDAMLALGPLVGVIVYAIFKADKDPTPGSVSLDEGAPEPVAVKEEAA